MSRQDPDHSVDALLSQLTDADHLKRLKAARAIEGLASDDDKVSTALIAALADPFPDVREAAARALRKIGRPAVPSLIKGLTNDNPLVRAKVVAVLGDCSTLDDKSCIALAGALDDGDGLVRVNASLALNKLAPPVSGVIAPLAKALDDDSEVVRLNAAEALGRIGRPAHAAAPQLRQALDDEDEAVRRAAADALRLVEP